MFSHDVFSPLPYKFMSEVLNKVVDFGPVMLHTARSKNRKARLVWGWLFFQTLQCIWTDDHYLCFCSGVLLLTMAKFYLVWSFIHIFVMVLCTTVGFVSLHLTLEPRHCRSVTEKLIDFWSRKWRKERLCWIVLPPVKVLCCTDGLHQGVAVMLCSSDGS